MNNDGYPEEYELQKIKDWPTGTGNWHALMEYVHSMWRWPHNYFRKVTDQAYLLGTGGWSGNESLIAALKSNGIFWMMCWHSSGVGGRYQFRIKEGYPDREEDE